jgi:hypothetical protein
MLKSTVELLGGLFLSALTLVICSCIVGSIVAALRAVMCRRSSMATRPIGPADVLPRHGAWPRFYVSTLRM